MACWNAHIKIAMSVLRYYNVNNCTDFLFGCLLPDVPHINWETARQSDLRAKLHYFDLGVTPVIPNIQKFLDDCKDYLNTDLYKGYYVHLLTDKVFTETAFNFAKDYDGFKLHDQNKYFAVHATPLGVDMSHLTPECLELVKANFGFDYDTVLKAVHNINTRRPYVTNKPYNSSADLVESAYETAIVKCTELALPIICT